MTTVFDATDIFKFIDSIIAQENTLQAGTRLKSLNIINQVSA